MSKQKVEKCVVDPADRVGVWEKCCYSIGFAGKDCFQTITNNYLMMFLMTVVGLNGGFIGTMMLGARIWDAINDPMLGSIADHTNSKFGRYRPYLLFSIPMAFIFALLFHTNGSFSDIGKMVYYTVIYICFGMALTIMEVPYFGLTGAMTHSPQERASITAWSRIFSKIPAVVVPLLLSALVAKFDGADQAIGPKGMFYTALIVGVVAILTSFFSFFGTKERALMPTTPKGEKKGNGVGSMAKDFLRILKGNWALLIVMIVQLFFTFNTILSDMINTYYLNYTLGSPALITGLGVALVAIGAMVGQFFYPYIEERVGSCKTFMIFGDICYLVLLVLCYVAGNTSTGLYLVMLVILNLFTGALQINVINLCFEVCDRLEYETGIRQDASIFAIVSFLMKLAAGLASTIAGFGLSMVGFEGMGPVSIDVTPAMASGVAVLRFLMPGIFVAVSLIAVLFYPIKKDDVTTIRAELRRRHHGEPQQQ